MIDTTKPLQTRSGLEVRIYATDGGGTHPIHGAYKEDGNWLPTDWGTEGNWLESDETNEYDLVLAPRVVFVNFYKNGAAYHHSNEASAASAAIGSTGLIASAVRVELNY
jgi:hypothetical protein